MSWHDHCHDFDSRVEASANDDNFNDISFLLTQEDAENPFGDEVKASKCILALISPTFYAQFYGPFSVRDEKPIEIVDGTARGFKQMIDFIRHPKSYNPIIESAQKVFEILYFAHKYQIWSLVSTCRAYLNGYDEHSANVHVLMKHDILEELQWALTNQHLPVLFPAEKALWIHTCWETIVTNFENIFPEGEVDDEQFSILSEDLMMKILGNEFLGDSVDESFLLIVALNFFSKLIENECGYSIEHKKLKREYLWNTREYLWNKKLDKIATIIELEDVSPRKFSHILEKIQNKIPQKTIINIMMKISNGWKDIKTFNENIRTNLYEPFTIFDMEELEDETESKSTYINCVDKEVSIKFRINKNSIFKLDYFCENDDREMEYISFQNETEYEEIVKEDWYERTFFAKENTVITLRFEKLKYKDEIWMSEIKKFHHSHKDFKLDILEVNGEPVNNNSRCHSVISNLCFMPI